MKYCAKNIWLGILIPFDLLDMCRQFLTDKELFFGLVSQLTGYLCEDKEPSFSDPSVIYFWNVWMSYMEESCKTEDGTVVYSDPSAYEEEEEYEEDE